MSVPFVQLAQAGEIPADSRGWVAEPKLDGERMVLVVERGVPRLYSRSRAEVSFRFPEVVASFAGSPDLVADGELTVGSGTKADFFRLEKRARLNDALKIRLMAQSLPARFRAFDLLALDGRDLEGLPLGARRVELERLASRVPLDLVERVPVAGAVAQAVAHGWEGIVFKREDSRYSEGERLACWTKFKVVEHLDLTVARFEETVGGKGNAGFVIYALDAQGKEHKVAVGGVSDRALIRAGAKSVEVAHLGRTPDGALRQPVFRRVVMV